MSGARTRLLESLRGTIARVESAEDVVPAAERFSRASLGHAEADEALQGGLIRGALHEVFAEDGRQGATAAGFIAGLASRIGGNRPLLWVRQDFSALETGALSFAGWRELGLDPRLAVVVHARDIGMTLRTVSDALSCDALGVVVLEVWGEAKQLDLVASRKLALAARASGVTALTLRISAEPMPSTAETRWIVRAAHSPPATFSTPWRPWGAPMFDAQLVRNRRGPNGQWIMEWKCDECLFRDAAAHSQPVAAAPADRSYKTEPIRLPQHIRHDGARRTG